jgi:hypothetical protein
MGIERLEDDAEEPTPEAHASPPKDTGRSRDAGRPGEPALDKPAHESPEATGAEVQPPELRTRQEHAGHATPRDEDSPLEANRADRAGEEADIPEDEFPEATARGEQPNGLPAPRRPEREQPKTPDDTAGPGDQKASLDDPHEHSAEPEDSNPASPEAEEDGQEEVPGPHRDDPPSKDWIQPLSREDRAKHIADVLDHLDKADEQGLSAEDLHTVDPAKEIWSTERTLRHGSLLDDAYAQAADVPCEYKAIIAGGLSGAGKTTVLSNHPQIDRSQYLTINPDNIKEEMARRGMIPEVGDLSPMEASDLVHEESSYLARQLALRAQADGKNLIWDITMSDQEKTERRIDDLREAGYTRIDGIFVEITIETSLRRTEERYWADQDKWRAGQGLGGRLIPPDVILRQKDDEWGSCNRKTFEAIKQTFENWEIRDNSVDRRPAQLIGHGQKSERDTGSSRSIHG